jgi:hypothetical protein
MKFNIKTIAIITGVVLALGTGAYFVFRPKKNEEENTYEEEFTNPVVSQDLNNSSSNSSNNSETDTETSKSYEEIANEIVKKGSKGDAAKGVQVIINEIARWRGWSGQTKKAANGKSVKFPISTDGDFGTNSDTAARLIFDKYQTDSKITRRNARLKWAYAAGFYKKQFPDGLNKIYKTADYANEFLRGGKASK